MSVFEIIPVFDLNDGLIGARFEPFNGDLSVLDWTIKNCPF
jgi:hypothetical protein